MTEGRKDLLVAAALAAVLFVIYAAGACRTIYVGDSGELVTAVHVLGIPHPSASSDAIGRRRAANSSRRWGRARERRALYNLGLIFQRNGLRDEALAAFRRSHAINGRAIASQSRARASDRVKELEALREGSDSSPAPRDRRGS